MNIIFLILAHSAERKQLAIITLKKCYFLSFGCGVGKLRRYCCIYKKDSYVFYFLPSKVACLWSKWKFEQQIVQSFIAGEDTVMEKHPSGALEFHTPLFTTL